MRKLRNASVLFFALAVSLFVVIPGFFPWSIEGQNIIDPVGNKAKCAVQGGHSAGQTTVTLVSTDPNLSKLPDPATDGAWNAAWWNERHFPDPAKDPNFEIVRVTAITGVNENILTVLRAQEGTADTAKNTAGGSYVIARVWSKKDIDDIRNRFRQTGRSLVDYGADTAGTVDATTALTSALADSNTVIVPNGTFRLSSNATLAAGKQLVFYEGGKISMDSTRTFTSSHGNIQATPSSHFVGAGSVVISGQAVLPEWFGAVGNGGYATGGAMTSTDATLTVTGGVAFTAADVGKAIFVPGAGAAGANLSTTIASFTSATEVELTAAAGTTVSAKEVTWGTDDRTAFASASSAGVKLELRPGVRHRIASNITIADDLVFPDGSALVVDSGVAVTISNGAEIAAGEQQEIFQGPGTVTCETYGQVFTNWWGASGSADFGLRWNRAAAGAVNARIISTRGGNLNVTTTLNATDLTNDASGLTRRTVLDFDGSYITFDINGAPFLDLSGTRFIRVRDLQAFGHDAVNTATVGILCSRLSTGAVSSDLIIENITIQGKFSKAILFNHGAELFTVRNSRFGTVSPSSGSGVILTDRNGYGVVSPYKTILGANDTTMTTSILEKANIILQGSTGTAALVLAGVAGLTADRCYLTASNAQAAHVYIDSSSSPTARNNRSLRLIGLHCEADSLTQTIPTRSVKMEGGAHIRDVEIDIQNKRSDLSINGVVYSAVAADNSITRSSGSFIADGFDAVSSVGKFLVIAGFTGTVANNGTGKIVSVAADKIVVSGVTLVDDAEGETVTLTALQHEIYFRNTKDVVDSFIRGAQGIEIDLNSNDCDFTHVNWVTNRVRATSGAQVPRLLLGTISVPLFSDLVFAGATWFNGTLVSRSTGLTERLASRPQYSMNTLTTATIASDAVTMTSSVMRLTPETGDTDDLITITIPSWMHNDFAEGTELDITAPDGSAKRIKLIQSGGGNIRTPMGLPVYVTESAFVRLRYTRAQSKWVVAQHTPLFGSATWDPADIVSGTQVTTTVTVTGAELGMAAKASFALDIQGLIMTAYVSSANTVTVVLANLTGGNVNLGSGNLRCRANW